MVKRDTTEEKEEDERHTLPSMYICFSLSLLRLGAVPGAPSLSFYTYHVPLMLLISLPVCLCVCR